MNNMSKISLLVITDGRLDCIKETLSALENFHELDMFHQRIILNDNLHDEYQEKLQELYGDRYEIHRNIPKGGFDGAIRSGWELISEDAEYIFHLEEDFALRKPVHFSDMVSILSEHPEIVQIALKRQPATKYEEDCGGIVEKNPDGYTELETPYGIVSTHREFFTTNPSLYRRSLLEYGFPSQHPPELRMTERLTLDSSNVFAFWGKKFDPPTVFHVGHSRNPESFGY